MSVVSRLSVLFGLVLLTCGLSGCGSASSFLAGGMADTIPAWAGGLPADAPPRPGTPQYDAYLKKIEQGQLTAGPAGSDLSSAPSASAAH